MLIHVPLDQIDDNPFQRRQDYGDVAGLAADIRLNGLLQKPLGRLVTTAGDMVSGYDLTLALGNIQAGGFAAGLRVQLAFGHRRVRAFRHLYGTDTDDAAEFAALPVEIVPYTDDMMLDAVWSENQNRTDINPIEQAELLAEKLERARAAGGNQTTVAAAWRLDRSTVANKIRLLDLPEDAQAAVRDGRLSERQALALLPVVELERKLDGLPVRFDTEVRTWGTPVAPADYIAHAVAQPDKANSDAIRDYARRVANHAGRPLSDDLATFDAGAGEDVVQPLCAGCRYRHNQHCLNIPCLDAKTLLFRAGIPARATELTGLPFSDDDDHFPRDRDTAYAISRAYAAGERDGLVVGWTAQGFREDWYQGANGYRSTEIAQDWRDGLFLGRLPEGVTAVADAPKPPRDAWRVAYYAAQRRREERGRAALRAAVAPLADQGERLRPLLFLAAGVNGADTRDKTIEELLERVVAQNILYTSDWRAVLAAAGLDPDLADPVDPLDRLREEAPRVLYDWYDFRDASSSRRGQAAAKVGKLLNRFEAEGVADADGTSDDLRELARWLAAAWDDAVAVINGGSG